MSNTQKAAATSETVSFDFDGFTYTIPTSENWSIDLLEAAENNLIVAALREMLGADQWTEFRKDHHTAKDLNRMFEACGKAVGAGN